MTTGEVVRLSIGVALTLAALVIAGRRVWWLYRLVRTGQPAPGRTDGIAKRLWVQVTEVFGQQRLLKWSVPGLAHAFTFWGFVVLAATIVEAYGALFDEDFHIPFVGKWLVLGFLEDFFAVAVIVALATFSVLRLRQDPAREHRSSRFYGSHTGAAWVILGMIFLVVATLLVYRGAQVNTGNFPWGSHENPPRWTFASYAVSRAFAGLSHDANYLIESVFLLAQIVVILAFLCLLVYSKHLHIALAPLNVATKRLPRGLGALLPMESRGQPIDFENPGEDDVFGRGKVEDFTWKGMLDFATCTECGRCQSQCPAWHTGKPLSPKLVIMDLRDHLLAKAPYLLGTVPVPAAGSQAGQVQPVTPAVPESGYARVPGSGPEQALRPLVGTAEEGGVIDPDVLWSCTTCGACVEQCPVDIEHVDHIVDMRRYQVLIESNFPAEAGVMLRNLESKGNPWGANPATREDWTRNLGFEVRQFGATGTDTVPDDVEYLFWVGCAGAFDDRAKKTTRAVATLLHEAGVTFGILGSGEGCTGDPARRLGNEFLFQMLAQANVETLNGVGARTIVATCPHCFNTLGNEYPQLGGHYRVIHHTQLLADLVANGALVPTQPADGSVTFHDPCYLGRHNRVFSPPRELLGDDLVEMPRNSERSFCCGAGGARMWMEERIGKRVNVDRVEEAIATGATTIAAACPFCLTMLGDGVTGKGADVEVADVATVLLRSVRPDA